MRRLVLIFVASVVSAGCGPSSYDDFRGQLQTRWCERQIHCGEVGASESQRCAVPPPLMLTAVGAVDVSASIASGRMLFHPDNAAECLAAVKDAPCDLGQAADALYRRCHGVVGPKVEVGKSCWGDEECVGGVCVDPDCGGTCTAYASPGAPCVASGGKPGATCDPTVQFCGADGTCQRKVAAGQACAGDDECLFDSFCVDGKCADPARVGRDDVCGTRSPPCEDGLYCNESGACEPLIGAGEACVKPDACAAGMVCKGGTCAAWLDVGAACSASPPSSSGCPASQACTAGACAPSGAVKLGPLARCAVDDDCAAGLYCSTRGYCAYIAGINGICTADHECAAGLACDSATHVCKKPISCPAPASP